VYAFDLSTGVKVWTYQTGESGSSGVFSSPCFADGVIYVGSLDCKVYAFAASESSQTTLTTTPDNTGVIVAVVVAIFVVGIVGFLYFKKSAVQKGPKSPQ
jgi:outer membrane protein assembly factor BamB